MSDEPQKIEVSVDGCVLWVIAFSIMPLAGALYAVANAIKALANG